MISLSKQQKTGLFTIRTKLKVYYKVKTQM